ncbi:MAG: nucleotidyltransferase family protein [Thermodesulfobacteriota bacterium]|nr:nucleotidyltransferase family protein [Thermodesulfobacteriota bacterium]
MSDPITTIISWLNGKFKRENQLNWDAILSASEKEGMTAILYTFLKDRDIPHDFKESLKASYILNYFHNTRIIQELEFLYPLFVKEDISFTPLKGGALILTVYNDIAHRPMGDIDLLVNEEDIERTHDILQGEGYSLVTLEYRPRWRKFGGKREYRKGNFLIDLHFYNRDIKNDKKDFLYSLVMNEMRFVNINEKGLIVPSPEDLFLHLLYHMTYHHFYLRLIWLFDVVKIFEEYGDHPFWEALHEKIIKLNIVQPSYYVLTKIKEFFYAPVPHWFINSIKPSKNYFGILLKMGKNEMVCHTIKFFKIPG